MGADPTVELRRISAALKATGNRGLQRELNVGLRSCTVFLEAAVRSAARSQMSMSGGLGEQQASQTISTYVLANGVRMRTVTRGSMQTDQGFVRHPVYGVWRAGVESQSIPQAAGWWSNTLSAKSALATPLIMAELRKAAAKIPSATIVVA